MATLLRKRSREIAVIVVFVILFADTASAASYSRINHLHNAGNQETISNAKKAFEEVASENVGIGPVLLKNLDAQTGLMQLRDDLRISLDDQSSLLSLQSKTWKGLIENYFRELGIVRTNKSETYETFICSSQKDFTEKIDKRIKQVQAIAKILETLADAQLALAKQTQERQAASIKQLTNSKNIDITITNIPGNLCELLEAFQSAVREAAKTVATNALVSSNITEAKRALAKLVLESRDPAMAGTLVASIGAGFSDKDFDFLESFFKELNKRLSQISQKKTNNIDTPSPQGHWIGVSKKLKNAKLLIDSTQDSSSTNNKAGTKAGNLNILEEPDNLLTNLSRSLCLISESLDSVQDAFDLNSKAMDNLVKNLNTISTNIIATNFLKFILTVSKLDSDTEKEVYKLVGDIVQDWRNEQRADARRLLEFFAEISKLESSVHRENARHYQALILISSRELKRWNWIQQFNSQFSGLFIIATNSITGKKDEPAYRPSIRLFIQPDVFTNWPAYYEKELANSPLNGRGYKAPTITNLCIFPPVMPSDSILPSLRLLAESARNFQTASPSQCDPLGFYTKASYNRLYESVGLIQGCTLMPSINSRRALENQRLLTRELKEHDYHLDGVLARATEADIRLGLGNQLAFHSSGISDEDLQIAFNIIQSGLLGWIGVRQ